MYINRELIIISNPTKKACSLSGWSLVDLDCRNRYIFPRGYVLPKMCDVTIHCTPGLEKKGIDDTPNMKNLEWLNKDGSLRRKPILNNDQLDVIT